MYRSRTLLDYLQWFALDLLLLCVDASKVLFSAQAKSHKWLFLLPRPPSLSRGGQRDRWRLLFPSRSSAVQPTRLVFGFWCKWRGRTLGRRGSGFGPLHRWVLVGGRAVVLAQTHGAQRVDGETDLLTETHQQPVDLPPQLPGRVRHRNNITFIANILIPFTKMSQEWREGVAMSANSHVVEGRRVCGTRGSVSPSSSPAPICSSCPLPSLLTPMTVIITGTFSRYRWRKITHSPDAMLPPTKRWLCLF